MLTSCSLSLPPSFNSLQTAGKSLLVYQNEKGVWEALAVNTASSEHLTPQNLPLRGL